MILKKEEHIEQDGGALNKLSNMKNINRHLNDVADTSGRDSPPGSGRGPNSPPVPFVSSPAGIPRNHREGMGARRRGVQVSTVSSPPTTISQDRGVCSFRANFT